MDYSRSAFIDSWNSCADDEARAALIRTYVTHLNDAVFLDMKEQVTKTIWSDAQKAACLAQSMRDAARLTQQPLHRAIALIASANVLTAGVDSYLKAGRYYRTAGRLARAHGHEVIAIRAEIGLVYVLGLLGKYTQACDVAERARSSALALQEWLLYVQVTNNLAIVHSRRCAYTHALALYDENRRILQRHLADHPDLPTRLINLELNRSSLLWRLNRYRDSRDAATVALQIPEIEQDPYRSAKAVECLGLATLYLGNINDALTHFQRARAMYVKAHLPHDVAHNTLCQAKCALALREPAKTERLCDEVLDYAESVQLELDVATTLIHRAMARRQQNKIQAARDDIRRATEIFQAHDDKVGLGLTYIELASLLLQIGSLRDAGVMAVRAEAIFEELGLHVSKARATLVRSTVAERQGHRQRARNGFRDVLAVARDNGLPWLTSEAAYGLARIAVEENRLANAIEQMEHALDAIEGMLAGMAVDLGLHYLAQNSELYEQAVRLAIRNRQLETAFNYAERAKSRVLLDVFADIRAFELRARDPQDRKIVNAIHHLREQRRSLEQQLESHSPRTEEEVRPRLREIKTCEARIENLFRDLQVRNATRRWGVSPDVPALRGIQALLSSQTRLIEYQETDGELWAFVVGPAAINVKYVCSLEELKELFSKWRLHRNYAVSLTDREIVQHIPVAQKLLGRLYTTLFAPLAPLCAEAGRLYIVPQGTLHYLPFGAFYDTREGSYLIERFVLTRLPSASLLKVLANRRSDAWCGDALIMGNSHSGRLPLTTREAADVNSVVRGQLHLEEEATREQFLVGTPDRPVVHVAAHGVFRPDAPLFSSIYLSDGSLTVLDILDAELPIGFLAFSACESGLSGMHPGDEILGLSLACLHAGVQSLLLSLWRIDDRKTHDFMIRFYNYLVLGVPAAEALALAQREHLDKETSAHPFFWGAFFVVGDAFHPVLVESVVSAYSVRYLRN